MPLERETSSGESTPLLDQDRHDVEITKSNLAATNLFKGGRAIFTQIGCLVLLITVMVTIVPNPAGLFSYHPPLQTLSIILFAQGILTLQPTRTKAEKEEGLAVHQIFQIAGLLAIIAGVSIMIANKTVHNAPHFTSWHGKFGLATYILLILQALVGIAVAHPAGQRLFGGTTKAKALWKYHRISGYIILPLALLTSSLATTSADWIIGHTSLAMRGAMTAALAAIALGLWSGASLKKLGSRPTERANILL